MEINIKHDENSNITAVAYGIGKAVEKLIEYHSGDALEINKLLEGRILNYTHNLKGEELAKYTKHFKIELMINPT